MTPIRVADGPFVPRMYPYWSNAWTAAPDLAYVFSGHADGVPRLWAVELSTGQVKLLDPQIAYRGTTEGWSWLSDGTIALVDGARLMRCSPFTGSQDVLLDITDLHPGCDLWQAHVLEDGTLCATVARRTVNGPYDRLGTIAQRHGRITFYPAQGWLDESQVTEQWLIIKEERDRNGSKLDNRVINLDTGEDYWLLDELGAIGHSDCDAGLLVGEDNYAGQCTLRNLETGDLTALFPTWNMGHIALRNGVCLRSNHELGELQLVALDGSGLTTLYHHGITTSDYDVQVRAGLDPTGRLACFLQDGALYLLPLPLEIPMSVPSDQVKLATDTAHQLVSQGYFAKAGGGDERGASYFARLTAARANPTGNPKGWGALKKTGSGFNVEGYADGAIVWGNDPNNRVNVLKIVTQIGTDHAGIGDAVQERRAEDIWDKPVPLPDALPAYLLPGGVVEPPPAPQPTIPSYDALGGDEGGKRVTRLMEVDYKRAEKAGLDGDSGAWQWRTAYDFLAGIVKTLDESIAKHQPEWRASLNAERAAQGKPPIPW